MFMKLGSATQTPEVGDWAEGDLLGFVRQHIGPDIAAKIQAAYGGTLACVPQAPEEHHVFSKIVGVANAQQIATIFGSGQAPIPLGSNSRRARIEDACIAGLTTTQIVKSLGCCSRTVFGARARLRRQGRLQ